MRTLAPIVCTLLLPALAASQVVRDGSIGPAAPLEVAPGTDAETGLFADYLIHQDLGETRGSSLYHSFGTFSVAGGEVAMFTGNSNIDTIVSRTTGLGGSQINGTLRSTIQGAELFFLSPHGLVIGQGAQLDVPGSVHFSTASVLRFESPALDLPTDSLARPTLLSTQPPTAYGFGPAPAPIAVSAVDPADASKTLSVPEGETLSFVGGDVVLTGFPDGAPIFYSGDVIRAPGAHVELAASAGDQDLPIEQVDGVGRLDLDQVTPDALGGEILLQTNARIDVGGSTGSGVAAGSVVARAGRFRIENGRIEATHWSDAVDAGAFDIGARDEIVLNRTRLTSATRAAGRGPDIRLESASISIGEQSILRNIARESGASGDIALRAGSIRVDEGTQIASTTTGEGAGGALSLIARPGDGTGTIAIVGGQTPEGATLETTLSSEVRGGGGGGAIRVEADSVSIADSGVVLSRALGSATGPGGGIEVLSGELRVENGSVVASSTEGGSVGGAVTLAGLDGAPAESVLIRNAGGESQPSRVSTNTLSPDADAGRGGDLSVRTQLLELVDGGQIFARTEGGGAAGALRVVADAISMEGVLANPDDPQDPFRSGITSRVGDEGATGQGTLLALDTRLLEMADGAQVSTATFGIGDAAPLRIDASERVTVRGGPNGASLVSAQAVAGPTAPGGGMGGRIEIETPLLQLVDGGQISAATVGAGNPGEVGDAGDVAITADRVEISGAAGFESSGVFSSSISAALQGVGDGGDVTFVVSEDLVLSDGGRIEVASSGDGNAGNIDLDVGGTLRMDTSARVSSATGDQSGGSTGEIEIDAGAVELDGGSLISASTGDQSTGDGGVVSVRTDGDLRLRGGARIGSSSDGTGDAGDVVLDARRISVSGGSEVSTRADSASGGSIAMQADELVEFVGSEATTSVQGRVGSDAGSIEIRTPGSVLVNRSSLVANAVEGAGGRIEIDAGSSFISGDSVISASSEQGPQGVLDLTPPEDSLISELASLPASLVDPSQLLGGACDLRTEREGSFAVKLGPTTLEPPDALLPSSLATAAGGPACEQ